MERVVIYLSPPKVISAAGVGIEPLWEAALSCSTFIKRTKVILKDFMLATVSEDLLEKAHDSYNLKSLRLIDGARIEPLVEAAVSRYGASSIGVCLGTCDNAQDKAYDAYLEYAKTGSYPKGYDAMVQTPVYCARYIKKRFSLGGVAFGLSTACSSSASAIIKAAELIEAGLCDAVIAGGVDVASPIAVLGFNSLGALSSTLTNPFSKNRNGLNLGEGAAFFLVSKEPLLPTSIRLLGWGATCDAYHITAPREDGSMMLMAIKNALSMARIKPSSLDFVALHGTGTKLNDRAESMAMSALGIASPCATVKPIIGHTLGAAAAINLAVCYKAIRSSIVPPQLWDKEVDPLLPAINLLKEAKSTPVHFCLSSSLAFGGANVALIVGE